MRVILFLFSAIAFVVGLLIFVSAKTAVQEIESLILFLTAAVFLGSAGIIEAVNRIGRMLAESEEIMEEKEIVEAVN